MASRPAPYLSSAAQRFIHEHTTVEIAVDSREECPICRDEYGESPEQRVRITGIPVCSHTFGLKCLKQFLATDPRIAKSCPMCRTQWLAGFRRRHYHWWTDEFPGPLDALYVELTVDAAQLAQTVTTQRSRPRTALRESVVARFQPSMMGGWLSPHEHDDYRPFTQVSRARVERTQTSRSRRAWNGVARTFSRVLNRTLSRGASTSSPQESGIIHETVSRPSPPREEWQQISIPLRSRAPVNAATLSRSSRNVVHTTQQPTAPSPRVNSNVFALPDSASEWERIATSFEVLAGQVQNEMERHATFDSSQATLRAREQSATARETEVMRRETEVTLRQAAFQRLNDSFRGMLVAAPEDAVVSLREQNNQRVASPSAQHVDQTGALIILQHDDMTRVIASTCRPRTTTPNVTLSSSIPPVSSPPSASQPPSTSTASPHAGARTRRTRSTTTTIPSSSLNSVFTSSLSASQYLPQRSASAASSAIARYRPGPSGPATAAAVSITSSSYTPPIPPPASPSSSSSATLSPPRAARTRRSAATRRVGWTTSPGLLPLSDIDTPTVIDLIDLSAEPTLLLSLV